MRADQPKNLSYVSGVSDKPLLYQTIGAAIEAAVETVGDREAVVSRAQNVRLTYRGLAERADALAAGLLRLGVRPGDRVGIWSPNNVEWMITQYATAKMGAILVTINPAYRVAELEYVLNAVQCSVLVVAEQFKSSDYVEMLRGLAPEMDASGDAPLQAEKLPHLREIIVISDHSFSGCRRFEDTASMGGPEERAELADLSSHLQPEDIINIQFTSGTTGSPKGAALTHHNILNNGYFVGEGIRLTEADRICVPVPLYHCFGMVMGNLAALTHGASVIYPSDSFDPELTLRAVSEERCTALYGVPTMFVALLGHESFKDADCASLRTGIMAGAPCPIETMKQVISELNMQQVTICYGMTETSPVSFQSAVDDPIEKRVSTLGRVLPHLEVKVVDDDGRVVPRGEPGELCTRGYSLMRGYWGEPERTKEVIDEQNWMHTGDLAIIDDEGYASIVGRKKDMIIRGGENIYPREIEDFLFTHADIVEAAVFGVPDAKYGEVVAAWVRVVEGAVLDSDAVRAFCQDQIAHYKIPLHVDIVAEFPMTVTGKIQKYRMRDTMKKKLKLEEIKTA